jgi:hypothetical protein
MAKKRGRPRGRKASVPETVGAALGTVMAKVDAWVAQRQVLANELQQVIGRAQNMLASLGPVNLRRLGKRGRPTQEPQGVGPMQDMSVLTAGSAPRRKRRTMSPEARGHRCAEVGEESQARSQGQGQGKGRGGEQLVPRH